MDLRTIIISAVISSLCLTQAAFAASPRKARITVKELVEAVKPKANPYISAIDPNDGWRWVYRKRLLDAFRERVYSSDTLTRDVIIRTLELDASAGLSDEILRKASVYRAKGEDKKALVLEKINELLFASVPPSELEMRLRECKDLGLVHLGYTIIGAQFERNGLFTEASGYYQRVIKQRTSTPATPYALFALGRVSLFQGKTEKATGLFNDALSSGHPLAGLWLGNAYAARGDVKSATEYLGSAKENSLDPVSALSLADVSLLKGEYEKARGIYERLKDGYKAEETTAALLGMKVGDTWLAEGRAEMAIKAYSLSGLKDEAKRISALAMGDVLAANGDKSSLEKAEALYKASLYDGFPGDESARKSLVSIWIKLGRYEDALLGIKAFLLKHPTSRMRADVEAMKGPLVHGWINSLFDSGDYYGAYKLITYYGKIIPYGKKSETFLKAGRAAFELGLYPDAVKHLDFASKLGIDHVAEEAYVSLARVYSAQKDAASVKKIQGAFKARFPKSRLASEMDSIATAAAFFENDFQAGASLRPAGAGDTLIKAASLKSLGRFGEAAREYEKALAALGDGGNTSKAADLTLSAADAYYSEGSFEKAAAWYKSGLDALDAAKAADDRRSWALYRLAACNSRLGRDDEKEKALGALKDAQDDFGRRAGQILKDVNTKGVKKEGV